MLTASYQRWATQRAYERARAAHGLLHPATCAALGRAVSVWGPNRVRVTPEQQASPAYRRAVLRATNPGWLNRNHRAHLVR